MRLNKYIAETGICSRRRADVLIANGNVKVNGQTISTMGYDVSEGDVVEVNGSEIKPVSKKIYILLNKPKGYITTTSDEKDRPTVMELVNDIGERVFPVGRLDGATTGILIMTNDGEFAYKLTHPKYEKLKTYRVKVNGVLSSERLNKLRKGVDIGGYVTAPANVEVIKQGPRFAIAEIQIGEGKNRQIRKMFSAVGNKVTELERIAFGSVRLGSTKQGHYRKLTQEEIKSLSE